MPRRPPEEAATPSAARLTSIAGRCLAGSTLLACCLAAGFAVYDLTRLEGRVSPGFFWQQNGHLAPPSLRVPRADPATAGAPGSWYPYTPALPPRDMAGAAAAADAARDSLSS